jgi:hypothetical protein
MGQKSRSKSKSEVFTRFSMYQLVRIIKKIQKIAVAAVFLLKVNTLDRHPVDRPSRKLTYGVGATEKIIKNNEAQIHPNIQ